MSEIKREVRASVSYAPGDIEFIPRLNISNWKCRFSKVNRRQWKFFRVYQYADRFDLALMIFGSLAAIGIGGSLVLCLITDFCFFLACYPIMFLIYQKVLNYFVDYSHVQTNQTSISNSQISDIGSVIYYYIVLGFVSMFLCWFAWTSWSLAAERQVRRIRFHLFRNILRQDIGWFDVHTVGELNTRLTDDLDRIKDGMSDKVPDFIVLFSRMIGSIVYSLSMGWKLTLVYLSISPLIILTFNLSIKMIAKYTAKEIKAFASASTVAQEVLQSIRTVTAFHGQDREEERFAKNLIETRNTGVRKGVYVGLCQGLNTIFTFTAFAIIVWYGPHLVRTESTSYSAGSVVVIFLACMTSTRCISQFIPDIQNFIEASGSGICVFDVIECKSKIDATSGKGDQPKTISGDIEFRNVLFSYPSRKETIILQKLSLRIPSGKTVALVGPSGCGKSTIIQLIQRFYDPDHGQILLDGKDIKSFNVAWLRSHIGIVSQEPVLFMGSIEENIRMGKSDATDEEVQNAAKMANAHEFIMALPENYKTICGDKLSGGQKQRVAIARALISNPKILLLDEATSALDNTSERVVQDALDRAKEGRTTLVIAHRLSTIRNADMIVGIERGEVVEYGNHSEFVKRKGLYYGLLMVKSNKEKLLEVHGDSDEEEEEEDLVQETRRFSGQSRFSLGSISDDGNENINLPSINKCSTKTHFFRTPFLWKIAKYNLPEWRWILLGVIVSIAYGTTQPFFGLVFSNIYGSFATLDQNEQESTTRIYVYLSLCIGIGGGLSQFLSSLSFAKSGEALTMRMRKLTFNAILRQNIAYFDQQINSTGALITRLSSDASALKGLSGVRIGIILQGISATVTGLIIGFSSSWKLTLVTLCFSPIMLLAGKFRGHKEGKGTKSKTKQSFIEQGGQCASEAIENIRTVVSLHQENHFIDLYEHVFNQQFRKDLCTMHLSSFGMALSNSVMFFVHCACFGYGRQLVENGEIEYVKMYRVFSVVTLAIFAVGRCMAMIPDYAKAKNAALRIMKLHQQISPIDPWDSSGIILENVIGNIEFRNVDFRYPSRTNVRTLKHFFLRCQHSQTTALVGPSGGGKSTTIALLLRFYDPIKGKVLLDGHDLRVLNLRWLRSLMGLVQQEPVLFNLSIRENIAYGDNSREVTQEEIEKAAKMANIHDLIISLPQGYDTLCGAKGNQLSGGQKQRIAIARALVRNPKVLLFDEATSALDNQSEKVVQEALEQASEGRTCLTIAHRLTTIENSDKIAVVNRGKIVEEGAHNDLLQRKGHYHKLVLSQQKAIST